MEFKGIKKIDKVIKVESEEQIMSDIELVIKIPKELYEAYKGRPPMLGDVGMDMIAQSIANGIPLPKGHDRLIEAKVLEAFFRRNIGYDFHNWIDIAPAMIEADKCCTYKET